MKKILGIFRNNTIKQYIGGSSKRSGSSKRRNNNIPQFFKCTICKQNINLNKRMKMEYSGMSYMPENRDLRMELHVKQCRIKKKQRNDNISMKRLKEDIEKRKIEKTRAKALAKAKASAKVRSNLNNELIARPSSLAARGRALSLGARGRSSPVGGSRGRA